MFKRIALFVLVNILVLLTVSIILKVLGVEPYLNNNYGINYGSLMVFCLVWGFAGSFISLLLSKFMAKMMMRVKIIDPQTATGEGAELLRTVERLAKSAGLSKTPEVGIYDSPEVNAFATGATKNSSLVAVSSGLLQRMDKTEVEGVLGHEIAHIANGDMVTLALIQGVINAFVLFFAKIVAWAAANAMRGENDDRPNHLVAFGVEILFQILFGILGSMVVAYFSRMREFRADKGGAQFAGREKMVRALEALRHTTQLVDQSNKALNTMKISSGGKFFALLATHPPLEQRIERLKMSV